MDLNLNQRLMINEYAKQCEHDYLFHKFYYTVTRGVRPRNRVSGFKWNGGDNRNSDK